MYICIFLHPPNSSTNFQMFAFLTDDQMDLNMNRLNEVPLIIHKNTS